MENAEGRYLIVGKLNRAGAKKIMEKYRLKKNVIYRTFMGLPNLPIFLLLENRVQLLNFLDILAQTSFASLCKIYTSHMNKRDKIGSCTMQCSQKMVHRYSVFYSTSFFWSQSLFGIHIMRERNSLVVTMCRTVRNKSAKPSLCHAAVVSTLQD